MTRRIAPTGARAREEIGGTLCAAGPCGTTARRYDAPMPPVTVPPGAVRAFASEAAFETWLTANHAKAVEIYLRICKKGSGTSTVTYAQALDVALCWGWIDGLKKGYDDRSFLQRFTPRRSASKWSAINREHVARLTAAKRMQARGQAEVDAAKADGRWDAAYAGGRAMKTPADLLAAIGRVPAALAQYERLDRNNLYALAWRVETLKTAAGRAKRIASFVELLARGATVHPMKAKKGAAK